jgi:hypothetical protein
MAAIDANSTEAGAYQTDAYQTDADVQASKRAAIGLSAHRPTAPDTVQRPPDAGVPWASWWPVLCLVALILALVLLVAARVLNPATTWEDVASFIRRAPASPYPAATVHFHTTFKAGEPELDAFALPGQAAAAVLPNAGVYRLDVWPGALAWSRFTVTAAAPVIVADAVVDAETPAAAAALIGRFEDDANFYLFTIDGEGRFGVMRYTNGAPEELQAPTPLAALHPAGQSNRLQLEDTGDTLRFLGNDIPLLELPVEPTGAGRMGVGALATGAESIVVSFDEIGLYEP